MATLPVRSKAFSTIFTSVQLIYWRTMTPPVTSIEGRENKITIKMKQCFDFVAGGVTAIVAPASGLNRASSQQ
ncbi:hypothetical protein LNQ52_28150 [Klebsiella pneumoniae subsp. pneumoniae]|nr:hypothetical protein [Klebsiella pneumoniae subsp. pneumoniae]